MSNIALTARSQMGLAATVSLTVVGGLLPTTGAAASAESSGGTSGSSLLSVVAAPPLSEVSTSASPLVAASSQTNAPTTGEAPTGHEVHLVNQVHSRCADATDLGPGQPDGPVTQYEYNYSGDHKQRWVVETHKFYSDGLSPGTQQLQRGPMPLAAPRLEPIPMPLVAPRLEPIPMPLVAPRLEPIPMPHTGFPLPSAPVDIPDVCRPRAKPNDQGRRSWTTNRFRSSAVCSCP
jgi:hypothetical protein